MNVRTDAQKRDEANPTPTTLPSKLPSLGRPLLDSRSPKVVPSRCRLMRSDAGSRFPAHFPISSPATRRADAARAHRAAESRWREELALVRRGLIPRWAKDGKIGNQCINARAEGTDSKPAFRNAFKKGRRCLVVADGFYEWDRRYRIMVKGGDRTS
jgi:SOS response associated peptidase (SRAP)